MSAPLLATGRTLVEAIGRAIALINTHHDRAVRIYLNDGAWCQLVHDTMASRSHSLRAQTLQHFMGAAVSIELFKQPDRVVGEHGTIVHFSVGNATDTRVSRNSD